MKTKRNNVDPPSDADINVVQCYHHRVGKRQCSEGRLSKQGVRPMTGEGPIIGKLNGDDDGDNACNDDDVTGEGPHNTGVQWRGVL